jgi:RimJ/RimL family protein N-acetyltransferase
MAGSANMPRAGNGLTVAPNESAPPLHLETRLAGCIVRPWRVADLTSLVAHANNRNVSRMLRDRFPHPYEAAHGQAFLSWVMGQTPLTAWAIDVGGEAVGGIGIEPGTDVERVSAEIGYWLGEAYWGRGISTAAVIAVTGAVFAQHGLSRVFALPFAINGASIRVLEKAGYALEGRLHHSAIKDGAILDQLLYAQYRGKVEGGR